jgi:hypothetical protein
MSLDFVTYTLRPWLVRWEQATNYDLFGARERATYFAEHLVDALLRGDIKSRYDAYAVGRQWGWLSADDVREMENMNPLPDGQGAMYMAPLNFVPAAKFGEETEPADNTPPADINPDQQRSAFVGLLRDVGDRMLKRELPQLRKALRQGEAAWNQSVEAVYRDHIDHFTKALQPVFDAVLSFGPEKARTLSTASRGLAVDLAGTELAKARRELDAAGFSGAEALLNTWEQQRADTFAERAADFLSNLTSTARRRVA